MPQLASAIEADPYLRCLILGAPKAGKSTCAISTAPDPVYVINCDDSATALHPAVRFMKKNYPRKRPFEWDLVKTWDDMDRAVKTAREGVKEGKYKTIVLDTISSFSTKLEQQCLEATDTGNGPDGRRAYPEYERRLRHLCERFFSIPAHFIALSHYIELGGEVGENGNPKYGAGYAPLLAGKARATVPMIFTDVIYMTLTPKGERIYVMNAQGAWGPGSRSLSSSSIIPADLGEMIRLIKEQDAPAPVERRPVGRNGARAT
jgi:hypothetical protein